MKPCQKNRNDKSVRVNIFSELLLRAKFFHYLRMNAISYYWSYGTSGKMHPEILSPSLTLTITLTLTQGENLLGDNFPVMSSYINLYTLITHTCHITCTYNELYSMHWLLHHILIFSIYYTTRFSFLQNFSITQLIQKRINVFPIINFPGDY